MCFCMSVFHCYTLRFVNVRVLWMCKVRERDGNPNSHTATCTHRIHVSCHTSDTSISHHNISPAPPLPHSPLFIHLGKPPSLAVPFILGSLEDQDFYILGQMGFFSFKVGKLVLLKLFTLKILWLAYVEFLCYCEYQ